MPRWDEEGIVAFTIFSDNLYMFDPVQFTWTSFDGETMEASHTNWTLNRVFDDAEYYLSTPYVEQYTLFATQTDQIVSYVREAASDPELNKYAPLTFAGAAVEGGFTPPLVRSLDDTSDTAPPELRDDQGRWLTFMAFREMFSGVDFTGVTIVPRGDGRLELKNRVDPTGAVHTQYYQDYLRHV